jgi:dihydrofolate reductase
MGDLIYVANVSLDGYVEDAAGRFDWTEPVDEVFAAITDLLRPLGTHLYGRRMYETMAVWELDPGLSAGSALRTEFARLWRAADKVVYSTTLATAPTARTRIERRFDPGEVRELKASTAGDLTLGGSTLAARAFDAGLVDEYHLFVSPLVVGAGKPAFSGRAPVRFELVEEERFAGGTVHLRYRVPG